MKRETLPEEGRERGVSVEKERKVWNDKVELSTNPNPNLGLINSMLNSNVYMQGKTKRGR